MKLVDKDQIFNVLKFQGNIYDYLKKYCGMKACKKYIDSQAKIEAKTLGKDLEDKIHTFCSILNPFEERRFFDEELRDMLEKQNIFLDYSKNSGNTIIRIQSDISKSFTDCQAINEIFITRNKEFITYGFKHESKYLETNGIKDFVEFCYRLDIRAGQEMCDTKSFDKESEALTVYHWNMTKAAIFSRGNMFNENALKTLDCLEKVLDYATTLTIENIPHMDDYAVLRKTKN